MAFQEVPNTVEANVIPKDRIFLEKTRTRHLSKKPRVKQQPLHKVNPNAEPPKFNKDISFGTLFDKPIDETFFLWVIFQNHNAKDQMVPNFPGRLLNSIRISCLLLH